MNNESQNLPKLKQLPDSEMQLPAGRNFLIAIFGHYLLLIFS